MLILTRKVGESITIGNDIRIFVLEIKAHQVRVGIEAPREVAVYRDEIFRMIRAAETPPPEATPVPPATPPPDPLP